MMAERPPACFFEAGQSLFSFQSQSAVAEQHCCSAAVRHYRLSGRDDTFPVMPVFHRLRLLLLLSFVAEARGLGVT